MPMRAMGPILIPHQQGRGQAWPRSVGNVLEQSARVLLSVTSALLVAIWSGMRLDAVLPEEFQGLEWVVLRWD